MAGMFSAGGAARRVVRGVVGAGVAVAIVVGGAVVGASAAVSRFTLDAGFASRTPSVGAGIGEDVLVEKFDGGTIFAVNGEGQSSARLVRVNPDGSQDAGFTSKQGSGFNGPIHSITFDQGKIVVGGSFTQFNGEPAPYVVWLKADGSRDRSVDIGSGPSGPVFAVLMIANGGILIGGEFTQFNGDAVKNLVRVGPFGHHTTSFTTNLGSGFDGRVTELAEPDAGAGVLVAGDFSKVNGVASGRIARLMMDGTVHNDGRVDPTFTPGVGFDGVVESVVPEPGGTVLVGGAFSSFKGVPVGKLVRLQANGMLDAGFAGKVGSGFGAAGVVRSVLRVGDDLFVGGSFAPLPGTRSRNLVVLDADGSVDPRSDLGSGFDGAVVAVTKKWDQSDLVVAGMFTGFDGASVGSVVKLGWVSMQIDQLTDQQSAVEDVVSLPVAARASDGSVLEFAASGLPTGLSIDPVSGLISGTLMEAGRFPVTVSATGGGMTDEMSFTWDVAGDGAVSIYRFYSPTFGGHFYTADEAERDFIQAQWARDWMYEGARYTAFPQQEPGTVPLFRFWSDSLKGHFYTADQTERDFVIANWSDTWAYEGVAYYVYPKDSTVKNTVPVFRFWGAGVKHHFYTASNEERDQVISKWPHVWAYEEERFRVPDTGVAVKPTPVKPADRACASFPSWAQAQEFFGTYYAYYGDFAKLDSDNDLIACESLPGAPTP